MDDASEAGIAFRIPQTASNEFLAALISSGDKSGIPGSSKVSLVKITNGSSVTQLLSKPTATSGAQFLNLLEVIDSGPGDLIEGKRIRYKTNMAPVSVKLDGRTLFRQKLQVTQLPKVYDKYRAGVFIRSGGADFSEILFANS